MTDDFSFSARLSKSNARARTEYRAGYAEGKAEFERILARYGSIAVGDSDERDDIAIRQSEDLALGFEWLRGWRAGRDDVLASQVEE